MNFRSWLEDLLYSPQLELKVLPFKGYDFGELDSGTCFIPNELERFKKQKVKREKFPKEKDLEKVYHRARAIHSFANHELQAIEFIAATILKMGNQLTSKQIKSLLSTLHDEQRHFILYVKYLNNLGYEFCDFYSSSFFWKYIHSVKNLNDYHAIMSLTFEQANLDFSLYFQEIFRKMGELDLVLILEEVYRDEIKHVRRGVLHLNDLVGERTLFDCHHHQLPFPLTPQRAKGIYFSETARAKAGLDKEYIQSLKSFDDSYRITKRKSW